MHPALGATALMAMMVASHASAAKADMCHVIRIAPDGVRTQSLEREDQVTEAAGTSGHASVSADGGRSSTSSSVSSSSSSSSRSSVSSSSHSSSSGSSNGARAVTSRTDARGRTITVARDERGCTITIDARTGA